MTGEGRGYSRGLRLSVTTPEFRPSPASFARFIGDFRNAALNASWSSARMSRASVAASLPARNARGANGDLSRNSRANFTFHGYTSKEVWRVTRFVVPLQAGPHAAVPLQHAGRR